MGRAAESAAIQRMLGRARLVTITGLPGVGKTAAGIAAAVRANFAEGAWLVPLDSLHDGDMLPHAIADALGIRDGPASCRLEALVDELCGRRLLLVLDTCEHLIGACAGFATALLLTPGRDVRLLATSREPLRVPGGLTVTIRPLPLRYAVELFGQRAAEAAPGFRISQENRETVEAICRRLDRLPLAIELAARQMASGSLEQLRSRLRAGYWFLRNAEDAPPRQETLHTAIGWSHQLCSPAERLLGAAVGLRRIVPAAGRPGRLRRHIPAPRGRRHRCGDARRALHPADGPAEQQADLVPAAGDRASLRRRDAAQAR